VGAPRALYFLVLRNLKARFRQTALGAAWAIPQPLAILFALIGGLFDSAISVGDPRAPSLDRGDGSIRVTSLEVADTDGRTAITSTGRPGATLGLESTAPVRLPSFVITVHDANGYLLHRTWMVEDSDAFHTHVG